MDLAGHGAGRESQVSEEALTKNEGQKLLFKEEVWYGYSEFLWRKMNGDEKTRKGYWGHILKALHTM